MGVFVQFDMGGDGPCVKLVALLLESSPVAGTLKFMIELVKAPEHNVRFVRGSGASYVR